MLVFNISLALRFINGIFYVLLEGFDPDHNSSYTTVITKALFNMLNNIASILSWIVIYYFVFEVQDVRDRLEWS